MAEGMEIHDNEPLCKQPRPSIVTLIIAHAVPLSIFMMLLWFGRNTLALYRPATLVPGNELLIELARFISYHPLAAAYLAAGLILVDAFCYLQLHWHSGKQSGVRWFWGVLLILFAAVAWSLWTMGEGLICALLKVPWWLNGFERLLTEAPSYPFALLLTGSRQES